MEKYIISIFDGELKRKDGEIEMLKLKLLFARQGYNDVEIIASRQPMINHRVS